MIKWIETTGRSEEDAISAALFQLGLDRDDVSVEVIERAKSGFLGFGSNPAKVRVSYEVEDGSPKPMMEDLLEEISVRQEKPRQVEKKPQPREEPVLSAAPVQEKEEEQPAAPVEEETILSAKPGWKSQQPRRDRRRQSWGPPPQSQIDRTWPASPCPRAPHRPH